MELETPIHTRTSRKGDLVKFSTAADVVVDEQVVIPNGSSVQGLITKSKRAGRLKGRAEVHLKIEEIRLANGSLLPLSASITRVGFDPIESKDYKDPKIKGDSGTGGDVGAIVKGGAQGAIIGVLTAGPKGAMYGSAAAAAVTGIGMLLRRGPDVDLPRSTMFEAMFDQPLEISADALPRIAQVARSRPAEIPRDRPARILTEATPEPELPRQPRPVLRRPDSAPAGDPASSTPEVHPPAAAPTPLPSASTEQYPPVPAAELTLSIKVRMVQVDAVVRDRAGRMIENLTKDDFEVFEDGLPQEIQSFSRDELPLAVALVIDRSGSVGPYISELRRIATRTLDQLKPKDEVALFSFADGVRRVEDLTADRKRIADAIARTRPGGGTNIVDAVHESITYLAQSAPERRHAVILVSDNEATVQPKSSEGAIIRKAMESETVVYSIKTAGQAPLLAMRLPSLLAGAGSVKKITKETGGEIMDAKNVASLDAALASVIARLRMRYSMGYLPPSTSQVGAFHAIEVRLADDHGKPGSDYHVHARRGYYATAERIR
jgi:Ca-activated chloride channel family protein